MVGQLTDSIQITDYLEMRESAGYTQRESVVSWGKCEDLSYFG